MQQISSEAGLGHKPDVDTNADTNCTVDKGESNGFGEEVFRKVSQKRVELACEGQFARH